MIFGIELKHKHRGIKNHEKIWRHGVRLYKIYRELFGPPLLMGAHCNSMELVFLLMAGWWSLFMYIFCIRIRCCRLSWVIPDFLQFRAKTVPLAPYLVLIFSHSSSLRPLSSQPFTYIFILSFCSVLCLQNVSPLSPPHSSLSLTLHSQNFEWVYWWFWVNCGIPTPTITMPFIGWHSCHLTPSCFQVKELGHWIIFYFKFLSHSGAAF